MRSQVPSTVYILAVAILCAAGCQPERPVVNPNARSADQVETQTAPVGARNFGIGDIETSTVFEIDLSADMAQVAGVEGRPTETLSDHLSRFDVGLRAPYPDQLLLAVHFYRNADYPEGFVSVARVRILLGDKEVHRFSKIYPSKRKDEIRFIEQFDVLPFLDVNGDQAWIHGEVELILFQNVKDASAIDPETADNDDPRMKVKKYSNPLFVHFVGRENNPSTP